MSARKFLLQFIAEHTFVYIVKGMMNIYDGSDHEALKA